MKIYDNTVQEYLKENGVSDIEISRIKYRELRKMTIDTLKQVLQLITNEQYELIPTQFSPAGDGMGDDNTYISFSGWDIGMIIDELTKLKGENDELH